MHEWLVLPIHLGKSEESHCNVHSSNIKHVEEETHLPADLFTMSFLVRHVAVWGLKVLTICGFLCAAILNSDQK